MRFTNLPGNKIEKIGDVLNKADPTISIITPFYNGGKTLMATANTIFSQTYPYFEWIIIDDGSKDQESLKKLKELEKMDSRVHVFHKENGGPSQARDYGITKANKSTKYIYFLDCDDLIENTMLETLYWTLETHPQGSLAYTSMVNFGANEYYWEPYLTIEEELVNNLMCISTMIKKDDLLEVNCFEIKEKAMHEDWNLWLKLLAKGKIPIRTNAPLFWYRTSETGELSRANSNRKKAMKLIRKTAKTVKKEVEIIQFPRKSKSVETDISIDLMILPSYAEEKTCLFILDNATLCKENIRIMELIKVLNKNSYKSIVVTTEPFYNNLRQEIKECCSEFYDLTNFLDVKDYSNFINYLVLSRKVKTILINNASYGYAILPIIKSKNTQVQIIDLLFEKSNRYTMELSDIIDKTITIDEKIYSSLKSKENVDLVQIKEEKIRKQKSIEIKKLKEKLGLDINKKVISFIDQLNDKDEINLFLNIAKHVVNENRIFMINGNGVLHDKIAKYIRKNGLQNRVFLFKEEELSADSACEISDILIDCSKKENESIISYRALLKQKPIIAPSHKNQMSVITEKNGIIIPIENNKKITISDYLNKYIEALDSMLEKEKDYKRKAQLVEENFSNENQFIIKHITDVLLSKPKKTKDIICANAITKCYLSEFNEKFQKQYLEYYAKELNITPREELDLSKKTQIRRKIRTFSLKYKIENEMHFCLEVLLKFVNIIIGFIKLLKEILIFIISLIPLTINIIKIVLRFLRILLSKVKQAILKVLNY